MNVSFGRFAALSMMALALAQASCGEAPPSHDGASFPPTGHHTFAPLPYTADAPDRPELPESAVKVVAYQNATPRPPTGIKYEWHGGGQGDIARHKADLTVSPNYPTSSDPHVLLGSFGVTTPERKSWDIEARRIAGAHGANLVMRIDPNQPYYFAFALSDHFPTLEEAAASMDRPKSYTEQKPAAPGDLNAPAWTTFKVNAGRCYGVGVVLREDARLAVHVDLLGYSDTYGESEARKESPPDGLLEKRAAFRAFGCVFEDGALRVSLRPFHILTLRPTKSDDPPEVVLGGGLSLPTEIAEPYGTGTYELRLYTRPMTPEDRNRDERSFKLDKCSWCKGQVACLQRYSLTNSACSELVHGRR